MVQMALHQGHHRAIRRNPGTFEVGFPYDQAIYILSEVDRGVKGVLVGAVGSGGMLEVDLEGGPLATEKVAYQTADGG
jgi:hypothetical protein